MIDLEIQNSKLNIDLELKGQGSEVTKDYVDTQDNKIIKYVDETMGNAAILLSTI